MSGKAIIIKRLDDDTFRLEGSSLYESSSESRVRALLYAMEYIYGMHATIMFMKGSQWIYQEVKAEFIAWRLNNIDPVALEC